VMGAKPGGMDPPPYPRILTHHDSYHLGHMARFASGVMGYEKLIERQTRNECRGLEARLRKMGA
jgi:hypothetical protein